MPEVTARFSFPSSPDLDRLKKLLKKHGFVLENFRLIRPRGNEQLAYEVTGIYEGKIEDLMEAWEKCNLKAVTKK
jgi:hypothetical protein